ncbi:group II truncated hemoglobin [Stieleria sp. ICT_E10.1]|uniref:group II truncated hemoglobin n=1 Tax=Stieleria sedimenti TaxID=2976331 RepID=UPI00217F29BB|nr:group II truncated hemoglobin [Stieleria sedimenti]MCS7465414.1 group II truncated hemoglobin [Stieleria sedimenti]
MNPPTFYEQLGGEQGLRRIVDRFYDLMSELPETKTIRALHGDDLTESRNKLFKFLSGFFGGPSLYLEEYGHPRLRARHLPFPIGEAERDQWLAAPLARYRPRYPFPSCAVRSAWVRFSRHRRSYRNSPVTAKSLDAGAHD